MDIIRSHFTLAPDAEISIEVDPRSSPVDKVEVLAKAGFNRMSIGVQDFDNRVQIAVNRVHIVWAPTSPSNIRRPLRA